MSDKMQFEVTDSRNLEKSKIECIVCGWTDTVFNRRVGHVDSLIAEHQLSCAQPDQNAIGYGPR